MSAHSLNQPSMKFYCNDCMCQLKLFEDAPSTGGRVHKRYLSNCFHVLCSNCRIKHNDQCSVCKQKCQFMEISRRMPKHFQWFFESLSKLQQQITSVTQFQRTQDKLVLHRMTAQSKYLEEKERQERIDVNRKKTVYTQSHANCRKMQTICNIIKDEKRRREQQELRRHEEQRQQQEPRRHEEQREHRQRGNSRDGERMERRRSSYRDDKRMERRRSSYRDEQQHHHRTQNRQHSKDKRRNDQSHQDNYTHRRPSYGQRAEHQADHRHREQQHAQQRHHNDRRYDVGGRNQLNPNPDPRANPHPHVHRPIVQHNQRHVDFSSVVTPVIHGGFSANDVTPIPRQGFDISFQSSPFMS